MEPYFIYNFSREEKIQIILERCSSKFLDSDFYVNKISKILDRIVGISHDTFFEIGECSYFIESFSQMEIDANIDSQIIIYEVSSKNNIRMCFVDIKSKIRDDQIQSILHN
jgi:hypothetical protein